RAEPPRDRQRLCQQGRTTERYEKWCDSPRDGVGERQLPAPVRGGEKAEVGGFEGTGGQHQRPDSQWRCRERSRQQQRGAHQHPGGPGRQPVGGADRRSEEHTSELQSPYDLVCRLLLEKKKLLYYLSTLPHNLPQFLFTTLHSKL